MSQNQDKSASITPVGEFEGYVDGEPSVQWFDRRNMPQAGAKLYILPATQAAKQEQSASSHSIVVGGQRVSMGVLLDLQRDAARYRWLRDKADSMACTAAPMVASLADDGRMVALIDGEDLDAAVDIAMARPKARRPAVALSKGPTGIERTEYTKDNENAN